jgi:hypothetical protein
MKNSCLFIGLFTVCLLAVGEPASAQIWWGGPGYYDAGGWAGAVALASSNAAYANQMQQANQDRLAAQQAARQRDMALGSSIRNTLSSQAQQQTNAVAEQRQSYKDWWFQTQQQQMAGGPAKVTSSPVPMAGGFGFRQPLIGGLSYEDLYPNVSLDIIKWPPVLQEREFASRRAQIEAPYRRSPPGLSTPTAADYRNMVSTVEQMKSILEWRLGQRGGLPRVDYEQAKAFLNNLAQEAQERAQRAGTSLAPERNPARNASLPGNLKAFTI